MKIRKISSFAGTAMQEDDVVHMSRIATGWGINQ